MSLPAADDLFRPTAAPTEARDAPRQSREQHRVEPEATETPQGHEPAPHKAPEPRQLESGPSDVAEAKRRPSGRVRHDEKMTVYITSDELLDLEHARLMLRRDHELAVDRGRLVREAVALALADLEARGEGSDIVQRLKQA